jgi:cytochrome c553
VRTEIERWPTRLAPGARGRASLTTDLTAKRGEIGKELTISYRRAGASVEQVYAFSFTVRRDVDAHREVDLQAHLFGPKCGRCHAEPAGALRGEALFEAVCSQCHGSGGRGASARSFNDLRYLKRFTPPAARALIAFGEGQGMPGYHRDRGGPLTDAQVDSLVDWIATKRAKWKHYFEPPDAGAPR